MLEIEMLIFKIFIMRCLVVTISIVAIALLVVIAILLSR